MKITPKIVIYNSHLILMQLVEHKLTSLETEQEMLRSVIIVHFVTELMSNNFNLESEIFRWNFNLD